MPKPKPSRVNPNPARSRPATAPSTTTAFTAAVNDLRQPNRAFQTISPRWLLTAATLVLIGAAACAWLTLCLLYWQGSWQLLYHPSPTITRTPASINLPFQSIHFAATETGQTQLTGWWIASDDASNPRTILYLHGATGNLGDTPETLALLHQQNVNLFAIDYRNYGQSLTVAAGPRPNEKQLRQDAEWALTFLTLTRQVPAKQIVIYGSDLGANLALELAADHPELAGVILDQPQSDPLAPLLNDTRSKLVPAHFLVNDSYDLDKAAASLKIPSLWLIPQSTKKVPATAPEAYNLLTAVKAITFLNAPIQADPHYTPELKRFLDDLQSH